MMKEFLTRGKKKVDIIKEVIWNSLIMFEILRLICLNLLHLIMLLILNVSTYPTDLVSVVSPDDKVDFVSFRVLSDNQGY